MSVTVTLFKGISPNYGKHYKFFTSYAEYIDSLGNYYKRYTLTDDRISDNQIIFSAAENVDAAEVSYCYINRNDGNSNQAYYFYHVTSGSVRGGMAFLQLELDVWATYLQRVNFGEIYVERCNRAIFAQGVASETEPCTGVPTYTKLGDFTATDENLVVAFVVSYDVNFQIFGNNERTTAIYGIKLNKLKDKYNVNTWEEMCGAIGNIYSYQSSIITTTNATLLQAYILPLDCITTTATTAEFHSKGIDWVTPGQQPTHQDYFMADYIVNAGTVTKTFQIPAFTTGRQFLGTKYYNLRLPRFISPCTIFYKYIVGSSEIIVNCGYGDVQQDITKAYQLDITISDNGLTTSDKISKSIDFIGNVAAMVKGGAEKDAGAVFSAGGNIVKSALPIEGSYLHSGGNAASTFRVGSWSFDTPYYIVKYTPILTAGYPLRNFGVNFNQTYKQPLVTIFNSALLGVGPPNSTYIQGDIDCYGAQKDVIDFFVQRFREGVYLEKI